MSRLKIFSRNLATSYLQLGVNVVYSLASFPIILHWLPQAEFGMWAVLVQLLGYVALIDLGMTSAVARLLVDYKDRRSDGGYGALIQTAFLVSLTQGLIILVVVTVGAPLLTDLMKNIPPEYRATFITLLRVQGIITAFSFSLRPLGLMLEAYQRMDILAYYNIYNLVAQLGLLVLFLAKHCGIYSFLYANAISALISPGYLLWHCSRLGFLPRGREWGRASWQKCHEVFAFGMDVFLFNLGAQLILSSQTIIVNRCLGLEAAAAWSAGTKIFNLCLQLLVRPLYMAMPALSEMIVRNEMARVRSRLEGLVVLTGSLGVYLGISFALCNSLFVGIWLHHRISWPAVNDGLLAAWLIIMAFETVHCNFILVLKQIGGLRYIIFLEGCCFVLLAGFIGSAWGTAGIIASSAVCTALFSCQYSIRRSQRYFRCGFWQVAVQWVRPCVNLAAVYGAVAVIVWFAGLGFSPLIRFCINASVALAAGGTLFLRLGCPLEMALEILERLPRPASKFCRSLLMLKHA